MELQRVFSGAPWEKKVGYCRAVKAGSLVFVTGTAPVTDEGQVHCPGQAYEQTKRCLEIISESLSKLDVTVDRIVRTRIFVTDIKQWEEYGRAHKEFFSEHLPTTTMVEVKSLIDPDMLVEIEADAVVR